MKQLSLSRCGLVVGLGLALATTACAPGASPAPPVLRLASIASTDTSAVALDAKSPITETNGQPRATSMPNPAPANPGPQNLRSVASTSSLAGAQALARALRLSGTVKDAKEGWALKQTDDESLVVQRGADGRWLFGSNLFCDEFDSCSVSQVPVAPTPQSQPDARVTTKQALSLAGPVLAASGIDADDQVRAFDASGPGLATSVVTASPVVDGLPTVGWDVIVEVTRVGTSPAAITSASGHLAAPSRGPAYPVIDATEALKRWAARPQPALGCPEFDLDAPQSGRPTGLRACAPSELLAVTLGLSADHDGERPVLVPAWILTVGPPTASQVQRSNLGIVAVQDGYLATPSPTPDPINTGGGSGSSAGSIGTGTATIEPARN